ncbi:VOC family protein [Ornithinimicrobium cavernae]|uniref:VOC family protein n=1 Tax=Ornithinimicrobium cavernae TaxID=2666047 RepID=UPI000D699778|nr:VOC family protein [Ornithinimicrobium cavernae]
MPEANDVARPIRTICYAPGQDVDASRAFYTEVLGLTLSMERPVLGLTSPANRTAQVLVPPVGFEHPQPSFGIDLGRPEAVDTAHAAALGRGLRVVYPLTDEPWGVRRFFVEDPGGTTINVLAHHGGPRSDRTRVTRVSPRLIVPDPDLASAYYQEALGAEQILRATDPDGLPVAVIHRLDGFSFTVSPAVAEWGWIAPDELGGAPVLVEIECADQDDVAARMADGGGEVVVPIENRPYGKREDVCATPSATSGSSPATRAEPRSTATALCGW